MWLRVWRRPLRSFALRSLLQYQWVSTSITPLEARVCSLSGLSQILRKYRPIVSTISAKASILGSHYRSCLASHGCQSGCWNGTATPSPTSTTPPLTPTPALTTTQKTGIIVGACLFAGLVAGLIFLWYRHRSEERSRREATRLRERPLPSSVNITVVVPDPTHPAVGQMMRRLADATTGGGNPLRLIPAATQDPYHGGTGRHYGGPPSYASS